MIRYSFICSVCGREKTAQTKSYAETVPKEICCGSAMSRVYKVPPVIFTGDGWTQAMKIKRGK